MKALVAGWFSFEAMGATAGDLAARDLVCRWLEDSGWKFDIAVAAPFSGGIDWKAADKAEYQLLVFVCGPFGNGPPITEFMPRFSGVPFFGVNLSMLQSLDEWNPFDLLIERDSSRTANPDLVFQAEHTPVPVAGLILVDPQPEYRERGRHEQANRALRALIEANALAVVPIDTRLDDNRTGLRTAAEIESLIARMDLVLTTRLHGMVMALKHGVPALVIDPILGGAKISRQARVIRWEQVFLPDAIDRERLQASLDFCLSQNGREAAAATRQHALAQLASAERDFVLGLQHIERGES